MKLSQWKFSPLWHIVKKRKLLEGLPAGQRSCCFTTPLQHMDSLLTSVWAPGQAQKGLNARMQWQMRRIDRCILAAVLAALSRSFMECVSPRGRVSRNSFTLMECNEHSTSRGRQLTEPKRAPVFTSEVFSRMQTHSLPRLLSVYFLKKNCADSKNRDHS